MESCWVLNNNLVNHFLNSGKAGIILLDLYNSTNSKIRIHISVTRMVKG